MLVCGEDLGLVPDFVPGEMQNLGIFGLRIQRMPAPEQGENNNSEFGIPSRYPYEFASLLEISVSYEFGRHEKERTVNGWAQEDGLWERQKRPEMK